MADKEKQEEKKQKTWKQARSQPRVRPQWDPTKLANEMLDDIDRRKKNRQR
jgi:hypothetical protein